jgi:hypothetical protein
MISNGDATELDKLLKLYCAAGQRGITKEQDELLRNYRSCMPADWNWKDENVDP